jgi:hypothetical protein
LLGFTLAETQGIVSLRIGSVCMVSCLDLRRPRHKVLCLSICCLMVLCHLIRRHGFGHTQDITSQRIILGNPYLVLSNHNKTHLPEKRSPNF